MLKYQIIANEIENNIYSNDLPQGTKLPTVETLASEYKVSKSTIVKAIESLVSKGLVYQLQGSGIFVRRRNRDGYIDLNVTQGFTNSLKEFNITSKVLELDLIRANEEIAQLMECDVNEEAYVVKRIRYINNEIMCYEEAYYKKSIVPYLTKEIAKGSIFEYLKTAFNLKPGFSDRYLHLEKLDDNLANILNLEAGDPAMVVLEQIYLPSGVSFNVSKLVYNYKNTQFFLQSSYVT
ncbi:GntR family transcriptional regulator [uncultured Clostridium sp.]|uniref:GntR family transcriptional regulator n=1 Tax=uncultured Clostridium sp. TaxID=59620 RepID=UPI0026192DE9|nr:GntR family transcriptional regulator [uncultured Clostridium sp.]